MENGEGRMSEKISDLTESLYRTTDVLSSADRMIDHYRGLNKEQEHEIARVRIFFFPLPKPKVGWQQTKYFLRPAKWNEFF